MGLELFRAKFLNKQEIGVTPIRGYSNRGCFSTIGNCWLDFIQKEINNKLDREIKIDNYVVDGFDALTNTVYEFNGCYFHCHHCIYKSDRDEQLDNLGGKSPNEIFNRSMEKIRYLQSRNFNVVYTWDCEMREKLKNNSSMKIYIKERKKHYKLVKEYGGVDIREAFFGGRTNNIRFWCDTSGFIDRKIMYYDFRSLYPSVLKYKAFPTAHPLVISENFQDINDYFGFIKCIILPPKKLYIPVLPYRNKKGKNLYPLCKSCADRKLQKSCGHTEDERKLIGTWTTEEIKVAVLKGYKILEIIEIYHYTSTSTKLFSEYVDMWLKKKQESDGFPHWVQNDDDKNNYIDSFLRNEGILLDILKVEKNPGLRYICKLFLNILWGKLAERPNLKQTKICQTYNDYYQLVSNENIMIKGELMVNEETLLVNYQMTEDENCNNSRTSYAIAAFVTSWARLELLKVIDEIELIPRRIMYMDTDSVIFSYKNGDIKPATGDYLGNLTDEIIKDYGENAICTKFCSLGPKVYAMEILSENSPQPFVPIKVKGISLTEKVLDLVNFKTFITLAKEFVENEGDVIKCQEIKLPQMQIRPTKLQTIETKYFEKIFRTMSEKRRIIGNDTLPFGYVD